MRKGLLSFYFFICISIVHTTQAQTYYISTIAGDGFNGYNGDGMAATTAELDDPLFALPDKAGNIYISDTWNNRVRKVDANGTITTFAGNGTNGNTGNGGPATTAEIGDVVGLAFDTAGNLYLSNAFDGVVRKIDTKGIITMFAGGGSSGLGDGGPATDAQIGGARGVVADKAGNVYIADQLDSRIRIVTTNGIINTFAGTGNIGYSGDGGQATDADLDIPAQLAIDDSGNVYLADQNDVIRKINTKGIISTVAGNGTPVSSGDGGPATNAGINDPLGVAVDKAGNIYIPEYQDQRVRKVDISSGIITTIAGTGVDGHTGDGGLATLAELGGPAGVSIDTSGNVYISEYINGNNDIRKLGPCPLTLTLNPVAPPPICNGQSVLLTAAGGGLSYTWSPGIGLSATTGDSVMANPTSTVTYTVTESDTSGCSITKYVIVKVGTSGALPINPASPSICNGQSITLIIAGGGSNFSWSPSTGLSATTGDTVIATPTITITYSATGTDSAGCSSSGTDVVSVVAAPNKPTITISVTGDSLISSATQGNQWYRNDTIIPGATNQDLTITGQTSGSYTVEVINPANGCSATSDSLITSSVNQLSVISEQLSVYPNPFNNSIFVTINSSAQNVKDWSFKLTDVLGRTLFTKPALNYSNDIDVSNLSGGVYFMTIINKSERAVYSVVKQ